MALKFAAGSSDYLRTLAPGPRKELRAALRLLERDARHPKLEFRMVRSKAGYQVYRARVGDYRICYAPRPGHTYVLKIFHRREGYDWLDRLFP